MTTKISNLSLRYIKANGEDKQEISMIKIMIREIIKTDIGQIVEIGEYYLVVEYKMDRITWTNQGIIRAIEVISEEGILNQIRVIVVNNIDVNIEEITETIIMKEEVGLGIDNIQIIPEEGIEVVVGLDQVQELVLIETEINAINAGNMIILPKIVQC